MLYHVAIPTDVSLLSLSRRQSRAAGLQRMTRIVDMCFIYLDCETLNKRVNPANPEPYWLDVLIEVISFSQRADVLMLACAQKFIARMMRCKNASFIYLIQFSLI